MSGPGLKLTNRKASPTAGSLTGGLSWAPAGQRQYQAHTRVNEQLAQLFVFTGTAQLFVLISDSIQKAVLVSLYKRSQARSQVLSSQATILLVQLYTAYGTVCRENCEWWSVQTAVEDVQSHRRTHVRHDGHDAKLACKGEIVRRGSLGTSR